MQEDEQKARVLEESIARWAVGEGPGVDNGLGLRTLGDPQSGMGRCLTEGHTASSQCGCGQRSCLGFPLLWLPNTWRSVCEAQAPGVLEEGRYHHQSP